MAALLPLRLLGRAVIPTEARGWVRRRLLPLRDLGRVPFERPELDPATRRELVELYREPNARLAELLDRDLSHWSDPRV